ncbi:MAG: aminotransferase class I/II-fold pyridoxal phosphate-dependent enzyme [Catonella sp.]|jgi:threonine aldolase|nr:aminotransferase class I/II-fold pyridoxal phosphate-dependent enzyme [Catonella sp.]MDY6357404.1 aminotransferase class I/II-fold pyridoxal phosphate-dependent enzyme [Catonella sp.]
MLHFESDYMETCHPLILKKLEEINFEKNVGYGCDGYCDRAIAKIKKACGRDDIKVQFLVGGTQTNSTVIRAVLRPAFGVISADTGHIAVHEAGAVEASGHKVLTIKGHNGKISGADVASYMENFKADSNWEHEVRPGMVYISHPTEYGTLYTKDELVDLYAVCRKYKLPLFVDGARLGYGLAAGEITLPFLTDHCDVFYIGGTKVGAMFGEAVVFTDERLAEDFFTIKKMSGGLLAKGWLLGVQFDVLFTDDNYLKISKNAIDTAMAIKKGLTEKGMTSYMDSPTNQQFFLVTNEEEKRISEFTGYGFMEKPDKDHSVIRFCTSWATRMEDVNELLSHF